MSTTCRYRVGTRGRRCNTTVTPSMSTSKRFDLKRTFVGADARNDCVDFGDGGGERRRQGHTHCYPSKGSTLNVPRQISLEYNKAYRASLHYSTIENRFVAHLPFFDLARRWTCETVEWGVRSAEGRLGTAGISQVALFPRSTGKLGRAGMAASTAGVVDRGGCFSVGACDVVSLDGGGSFWGRIINGTDLCFSSVSIFVYTLVHTEYCGRRRFSTLRCVSY